MKVRAFPDEVELIAAEVTTGLPGRQALHALEA